MSQTPPLGGRNFEQNQRSDLITRSLRLLYYDLANVNSFYSAIHHGVVCTL